MNVAIIGCGYVADFYAKNAAAHAQVNLCGAFDHDADRAAAFCSAFGCERFDSLDALLGDEAVELVVNLTNPRAHFEINKACLETGKHVYSEKPLAMTPGEAEALADLARERGVRLGSAPCGVLGDTAQTMWKAVREGAIGRVRLVYAAFDDGLITPGMTPWDWTSQTGAHWPAKDEFEIGCTYEHAGYLLTWLAAMFGPARRITSHASCLVPDKGIEIDEMAPDFTVGCIEYGNGVVARVTCGLVAPFDKSFMIVGERGTLFVNDLRNDTAPVYIRTTPLGGALGFAEKVINRGRDMLPGLPVPWPRTPTMFFRRVPMALGARPSDAGPGKPVDFMLGVRDMIEAIEHDRPHRLSAELGVHVAELIEALQHPERRGHHRAVESSLDPMQPRWDSSATQGASGA